MTTHSQSHSNEKANSDKGSEKGRSDNVRSLNQALSVLNDAAKESSEEIKQMLNTDFKRVKDVFTEIKPEIKGTLKEIKDTSAETIKNIRDQVVSSARDSAIRVNDSAHKSPWYFIGGAAVLATVVGFMMGRKTCSNNG